MVIKTFQRQSTQYNVSHDILHKKSRPEQRVQASGKVLFVAYQLIGNAINTKGSSLNIQVLRWTNIQLCLHGLENKNVISNKGYWSQKSRAFT